MDTLKTTIKQLQDSVAEAFPGMEVAVNISIAKSPASRSVSLPAELPGDTDIPKDLAKEIDLAALKSFLNAFIKIKAEDGEKEEATDMAFNLVEKYAGGSRNPADIPIEHYTSLITDVMKEHPGIVIQFKKDGEEWPFMKMLFKAANIARSVQAA